jgi:cytochrome c biogenesis protein CcmG/thiol:disulfide interchange protein DsbE
MRLPSLLPGHPEVTLVRAAHSPVVLNFFASWCAPCKQELPLLARAARQEQGSVKFIGVDVNDDATHARQLIRSAGVNYPVGQDPKGQAAVSYGLLGLPTTVFIGANGRVVHATSGQLTPASLDHWLRALSRSK